MALLRMQNIQVSYSEDPLLDDVNFSLEAGERVALVGRNGAGKSTLMKMITSEIVPDDGQITFTDGVKVARLEQDVPRDLTGNVETVIASGLGDLGQKIAEYHHVARDCVDDQAMQKLEQLQIAIEDADGWSMEQKISSTISRLLLPAEAEVGSLSGGMLRRVLLARALVCSPDILLLDEPSNHLDIEAIEWLESFLLSSGLTLIFITHDRTFLRRLATRIVEIDRGNLTSWPGDFDTYLERKQQALEAEEKTNAEFDKKLAQEEVWIRQGIKARRTRNEGRVRNLKKLRGQRAERRNQLGTAKLQVNQSEQKSGKVVAEAENLSFSYDGKPVFTDLTTTILRGDKIGIIGSNGAGKSTLIRVLLGELEPDSGRLKLGTNLEVAYFDQLRGSLNPDQTPQENVASGSDSVIINGKPLHVISYLQDFLFSPKRARAPITKLSGGEKNRLLLAKLFAKPANLLVLDEPTNDLDVETLELLEELLADYDGTVLLVSHDREFLDRVVTSSLVFDRPGVIQEYVGGYSDWLRQRPDSTANDQTAAVKNMPKNKQKKAASRKLSYKIQRELDALPEKIENLETEKTRLEASMSDPGFYEADPAEITVTQNTYEKIVAQLDEAYARWEKLEDITEETVN